MKRYSKFARKVGKTLSRNRNQGYVSPKGKILNVQEENGVTRLIVEFDRMDSGPVAPAGLYIDPMSGNATFELHRVIGVDALVFTFETFSRTHALPGVGDIFSYRGWWMPAAMEAALDTGEAWERKSYPDDGDHDHCLFTWESIASYTDHDEGYFSSKYGWITCESFDQFISGGLYRLREAEALTNPVS